MQLLVESIIVGLVLAIIALVGMSAMGERTTGRTIAAIFIAGLLTHAGFVLYGVKCMWPHESAAAMFAPMNAHDITIAHPASFGPAI